MAVELKIVLDIAAGLQVNAPKTKLPIGSCSACRNVVILDKSLRARPGVSLFPSTFPLTSSTIVPLGIAQMVKVDGTQSIVYLFWDTSTSRMGAAYGPITGGYNTAGATINDGNAACLPDMVRFKDRMYFTTGGVGALYEYTLTAGVQATAVVNVDPTKSPCAGAYYLAATNSRLIMFNLKDTGGTRVPYRVEWCDWLLPTVWNNNGSSRYVDLMDEPDAITAGTTINNDIYAFKATKIYRGVPVGSPDFYAFMKVSDSIGCTAFRTIKAVDDTKIFQGPFGVYMLQAGQKPQPISDSINRRIQTVQHTSYTSKAFAVLDPVNLLYYLFMTPTGSTYNSKMFALNLATGTWTESDITDTSAVGAAPVILRPVCGCDFYTSPWSTTQLLAFNTNAGAQYGGTISFTATQDISTSFTPTWTSQIYDVVQLSQGQLERAKLDRIVIEAESGVVAVTTYAGDQEHCLYAEDPVTLYLARTSDGNRDDYAAPARSARYFQFKLDMTDRTNFPQISNITLFFRAEGSEVRSG